MAPFLDRAARTVVRPLKSATTTVGAHPGAGSEVADPPILEPPPVPAAAASSAAALATEPVPVTPSLSWASVGWGSLPENLIVGVVTAALLGLAAARLGAVPALGAYCPLLAALTGLSVIDLRTGLLPKRFVYPAWGLVAIGLVAASNVDSTWHQLERAGIGLAAAFLIFYVVWFVYPKGMGFGDVRLAGLLGMSLGWLGWRQEYIGFLAACVLGSVLGIAFLIVVGRSRPFPFGPALAAGAAFGVLWGGWLGDLWIHPG